MANYTNAQKLAAVLNKWAAPMINSIVEQNIGILPMVANIQTKMRSTGWVSPNWSVAKELAPLMCNVTSIVVEPILAQYIAGVPDESIPKAAHAIVDNAISKGSVSLLEGRITFDANDLQELKRYLIYNLPLDDANGYEVKVEP